MPIINQIKSDLEAAGLPVSGILDKQDGIQSVSVKQTSVQVLEGQGWAKIWVYEDGWLVKMYKTITGAVKCVKHINRNINQQTKQQ